MKVLAKFVTMFVLCALPLYAAVAGYNVTSAQHLVGFEKTTDSACGAGQTGAAHVAITWFSLSSGLCPVFSDGENLFPADTVLPLASPSASGIEYASYDPAGRNFTRLSADYSMEDPTQAAPAQSYGPLTDTDTQKLQRLDAAIQEIQSARADQVAAGEKGVSDLRKSTIGAIGEMVQGATTAVKEGLVTLFPGGDLNPESRLVNLIKRGSDAAEGVATSLVANTSDERALGQINAVASATDATSVKILADALEAQEASEEGNRLGQAGALTKVVGDVAGLDPVASIGGIAKGISESETGIEHLSEIPDQVSELREANALGIAVTDKILDRLTSERAKLAGKIAHEDGLDAATAESGNDDSTPVFDDSADDASDATPNQLASDNAVPAVNSNNASNATSSDQPATDSAPAVDGNDNSVDAPDTMSPDQPVVDSNDTGTGDTSNVMSSDQPATDNAPAVDGNDNSVDAPDTMSPDQPVVDSNDTGTGDTSNVMSSDQPATDNAPAVDGNDNSVDAPDTMSPDQPVVDSNDTGTGDTSNVMSSDQPATDNAPAVDGNDNSVDAPDTMSPDQPVVDSNDTGTGDTSNVMSSDQPATDNAPAVDGNDNLVDAPDTMSPDQPVVDSNDTGTGDTSNVMSSDQPATDSAPAVDGNDNSTIDEPETSSTDQSVSEDVSPAPDSSSGSADPDEGSIV